MSTGASKGWKRKSSVGVAGRSKSSASCSMDFDGSDGCGGRVFGVGAGPVGDVLARGGGQRGVELDADDFAEAGFAGDEQAAALAGADVDEGVAG